MGGGGPPWAWGQGCMHPQYMLVRRAGVLVGEGMLDVLGLRGVLQGLLLL